MLQRLNDTTSLILKLLIIFLATVAILYLGVSVYGNIAMSNALKTDGLPAYPGVSKAPYEITLTTTGAKLLVKEYDNPSDGVYILNGYYSLKDDRWQWTDRSLKLDEYYFGDIKIIRRVK